MGAEGMTDSGRRLGADGDRTNQKLKILAVSYMLPPNLFPQAIQIGRLLYHTDAILGVVSGKVSLMQRGLDCYPGFDERLDFRLEVPFRRRLQGLAHRIAFYGLPFYARSPDEYRSWVPFAEKAVFEKLSATGFNPDAMVTFGEPMSDHILGLRLKERLGIPWVAHFSDPWSDNPFRRRFFLANFVNKRLERRVVCAADRVIFTSKETADLVMAKYPREWLGKSRVLHHSFEPTLYKSALAAKEDTLVVRYLGHLYGNRSPRPLFEALAAIHRDSPRILEGVRIELVGNVPSRMFLSSAFRSLPPDLIKKVPTVSYSRSLELMVKSDLLLVIDAPGDGGVFLPSKLVDYLGASVPIMALVPTGASEALVRRLGGYIADPRRPQDVRVVLAQALAEARRRRAEGTKSWGNETVTQEYLVDNVAGRFLSIVREAAEIVAV
jgi:glycosyltransferase involved in cell wall biosynthesis